MKTKRKEHTGLGKHPEARFFEQAQAGCQESLNLLMARHEGLVVYAVRRQNLGDLPYEEAVQAGRIGLWHAIKCYDAHRGYRFSSYAYPAIVRQVWRVVKVHCEENRRAGANGELKLFYRHWEEGPEKKQAVAELKEGVDELVRRMPGRLGKVIKARYGLGVGQRQTLAQVGSVLGVSGERVRQLQQEALVWLRHPAHSQELREMLQRHSQQEYERAEELAQAWLRRRGGRHGQPQ